MYQQRQQCPRVGNAAGTSGSPLYPGARTLVVSAQPASPGIVANPLFPSNTTAWGGAITAPTVEQLHSCHGLTNRIPLHAGRAEALIDTAVGREPSGSIFPSLKGSQVPVKYPPPMHSLRQSPPSIMTAGNVYPYYTAMGARVNERNGCNVVPMSKSINRLPSRRPTHLPKSGLFRYVPCNNHPSQVAGSANLPHVDRVTEEPKGFGGGVYARDMLSDTVGDGPASPLVKHAAEGDSGLLASEVATAQLHAPPASPVQIRLGITAGAGIEGEAPNGDVYFSGLPTCGRKRNNHPRVANPTTTTSSASSSNKNYSYDDENHHYRIVIGDHLAFRFEVLQELGRGTFGVVVKAFDHKEKRSVAVKIIKNKPNYTKQAKEEVRLLELLQRDDPDDAVGVVRLLETLMFRNHLLLIFELLGIDLYRMCSTVKFAPMSMHYIRDFSRQILTALEYVRRHHIIHCDIKPENIVLCSEPSPCRPRSRYPHLKLIDFGSACFDNRCPYTYIQSRYYRAPEIVLGIPYTAAIDMWSFGCVLCELANGYPIFPATSQESLLRYMIEFLGPIPMSLVARGKRGMSFFTENGELRVPESSRRRRHVPPPTLYQFLKSAYAEKDSLFVDFVRCCLTYDPTERVTPEEALKHPWVTRWES